MRNMRKWAQAVVASLALFSSSTLYAETYAIDPAHTSVSFKIKHLVGSVRGGFGKVTGSVDYDEANPDGSAVNVIIDVNSVDTYNADRDKHLKNEDFFDTAKYPEMTFKSKKVAAGTITGDLTLHGVTKEIEIPYTLGGLADDPWGNKRLGGSGEVKLDRRDFGMKYDPTGISVGNDVQVFLDVEATKKK